jgi:hypothetical protein
MRGAVNVANRAQIGNFENILNWIPPEQIKEKQYLKFWI